LPFKGDLWLTVGAAILLMSLLITMQERAEGVGPQDLEQPEDHETLQMRRTKHTSENLLMSFRAVYDGGIGHSKVTSARLSQLGLGFFILLVTNACSYTWLGRATAHAKAADWAATVCRFAADAVSSSRATQDTANLTTFLVSKQRQSGIRSWTEATERGMTVCGTRVGSLTARSVYPTARWVNDPVDGQVGIIRQLDVLEYMSQGVCDVAVMDPEDLNLAHMDGLHCDKASVGLPVAYETVGMPLSAVSSMGNDLGSAFARAVESGEWERAKAKYRRADRCQANLASTGPPRLSTLDLLGAFVLLALFVAATRLKPALRGSP
jgi:hypothetical protein